MEVAKPLWTKRIIKTRLNLFIKCLDGHKEFQLNILWTTETKLKFLESGLPVIAGIQIIPYWRTSYWQKCRYFGTALLFLTRTTNHNLQNSEFCSVLENLIQQIQDERFRSAWWRSGFKSACCNMSVKRALHIHTFPWVWIKKNSTGKWGLIFTQSKYKRLKTSLYCKCFMATVVLANTGKMDNITPIL